MKIAFTGTQNGMTPSQKVAFVWNLGNLDPELFRQGCCVGADEDAALLADKVRTQLPGKLKVIAGHPSDIVEKTSEKAVAVCDEVAPVSPPLDRNHHMVDDCDLLIACPKGAEEVRSGTWATVRYARRVGKAIKIIWPDGKVSNEGTRP